jgi:hypothetical protein
MLHKKSRSNLRQLILALQNKRSCSFLDANQKSRVEAYKKCKEKNFLFDEIVSKFHKGCAHEYILYLSKKVWYFTIQSYIILDHKLKKKILNTYIHAGVVFVFKDEHTQISFKSMKFFFYLSLCMTRFST